MCHAWVGQEMRVDSTRGSGGIQRCAATAERLFSHRAPILALTTHYRFHMRVSNEKAAGGRVRIRVHLGCAGLMR
jgi:hypothetical protein